MIGRPLPRDATWCRWWLPTSARRSAGGYATTLGRRSDARWQQPHRAGDAAREQPRRELLRAAICDDELIQAIGRGRGINRTAADPLEVHLLADVALPLVHDRVLPWETVAPDLFQRMLLGGVAVDSPADAARLHPALFTSEKQAQKEFERAGFKRQNPIREYL